MKRFGIRNYGPTRQLPYKDQQILVVHDGFIDTDDVEMAVALGEQEKIFVTDNGAEFAPVDSPVEKSEAPESEVVEAPDDISYNDMTIPELKVLAKDRELDVKGLLKAEIIEALQTYDAEPDVPETSGTSGSEELDVSEKFEESESEDDKTPELTEPEKKAPKKSKKAKKSKDADK